MARHKRTAAQRYHDRVAGKYDQIYDDAYWNWHDHLTWEHLRTHLPRRLGLRALDLGCGTGKWGLRLLESGFHVTFVDVSSEMLDQARAKVESTSWRNKAEFVAADLMDLSALPEKAFEFASAMGEPLCSTEHPPRALGEIRRALSASGVLVATVDNRLACMDHYLERGESEALAEFLKSGRTSWLTRDKAEQFELHTWTPAQLRQMVEKSGYEVLDLIGKTVLPMRARRELLGDSRAAREWAAIERGLHRVEAALGRCAHLQFAARRIES